MEFKGIKVLCRTQEEFDKVLAEMLDCDGQKSIYLRNYAGGGFLFMNHKKNINNVDSLSRFLEYDLDELQPSEVKEYLEQFKYEDCERIEYDYDGCLLCPHEEKTISVGHCAAYCKYMRAYYENQEGDGIVNCSYKHDQPKKRQATFEETIKFIKEHLEYEYTNSYGDTYLGYGIFYEGSCVFNYAYEDLRYRETPKDEWKIIEVDGYKNL